MQGGMTKSRFLTNIIYRFFSEMMQDRAIVTMEGNELGEAQVNSHNCYRARRDVYAERGL